MIKLPLIESREDVEYYPYVIETYPCAVCGVSNKITGFAYMSFGVGTYDSKGDTVTTIKNDKGKKVRIIPRRIKFHVSCQIGFDGCNYDSLQQSEEDKDLQTSNSHSSRDVAHETIDILKQHEAPFGDFYIKFCSIHCMRNFFNAVFDDFAEDFYNKHGVDP